jgi:hypothetical protein
VICGFRPTSAVSVGDSGYVVGVDTYEIVVRERLSPALVKATGTDSASSSAGMTTLVADNCDQARLHSLFGFLRNLNVSLVSVNAVVPAPAQG